MNGLHPILPAGARVIEAVIDGRAVRFCVADADDKIQRKHAQGKFWERDEMAVMAAHFPPGGTFVDIGANVGNHTLFACLFMDARVIAFEPNPPAMALLRANVALNGLWSRVDLSHLGLGLSDVEGAGFSTVTKRANLGATRLVAGGTGGIAVRTGDAMLADQTVDFIKLDIEGMEMEALRGLSATIARDRPPVFLELDHENVPAFHDWLAATNYVIAHEGPRYPANQDFLVLPKEKKMLEIRNLHVKLEAEDKAILKGVDLSIQAGSVHAIMGPNGSGKSTLSYVLAGREGYAVTEGSARLEGAELLDMEPEERAAAGLFLAFQYPVEIPGVGNMTFLRTAVNAQRKARGEPEMSAGEFLKVVRAKAATLQIDADMMKRPVNVGFSGGEKKRNEILQMAMLEPRMCILDETDSGLDVDAMKLVAEGVNALRDAGRSFLVITHYQRLLDHIRPDIVHIMAEGRIVKTGGPELALEVETNGYADILREGA